MSGIFISEQKALLRDKAQMFMITLFPTILVFILGTMLASLDNPDEVVEPFRLAYVIDSDDPVTTATAETVIAQFDEVEQVAFVEYDSLAATGSRLADGELGAVVVFTEPFGIEIHEGSDSIQNRAVHTIFEGVARLHASIMVASVPPQGIPVGEGAQGADVPAGAIPGAAQDAAAPATPGAPSPSASFDPDALASTSRVEEATYGVTRTMMDYYAITMIVMMFFMGSALAGASTFYRMRRDGTLRRVLASPLSRTSAYLQLLASQIPLNIMQVGIVMIISTSLFGAHYASDWQSNALLFAMLGLAGFASSSLFFLLGIFVRINPLIIIMPVMWVVLFLSGTFSKEIFIPVLSPLMPPYAIQTAAFDLTLFGHTGPAITVLVVSLVVVVVSTIVGNLLLGRKGVAS
jgi:ABC-2 type transport system permease protein